MLQLGAGALYDGLFEAPVSQPFVEAEAEMSKNADVNIIAVEADRATNNDKMLAHWFALQPDDTLIIFKVCSPHGNSLVEGSAICAVGMDVLQRMYSSCLFFAMGKHFMRICLSLDVIADNYLDVYRYPPAENADLLINELQAYHLANYKRFKVEGRNGDDTEYDNLDLDDDLARMATPTMRRLAAKWDDLRSILNGDIGRRGRFGHHCLRWECCNGYDRQVTKKRFKKAMLGIPLAEKPLPPAANKWTKLGPCSDYFVLNDQLGGFLELQSSVPFQKFKCTDEPVAIAGGADQAFVQDIDWAAIAGYRLAKFKACASNDMQAITTLALGIEAVRYLTEHFLATASERRNRHAPTVFNFIDERRSPVTTALQYMSKLLSGRCSRMILLWKRKGFASRDDWAQSCPDDILLVRHTWVTIVAWIDERHRKQFKQWQLKLLMLGDARQTACGREGCLDEFYGHRPCCLRWGLARRVREQRPRCELESPRWSAMLYRTASMIMCGIPDVECRHARNKQHLRSCQAWYSFASNYINAETKSVSVTAVKRRLQAKGVAALADQEPSKPLLALGHKVT